MAISPELEAAILRYFHVEKWRKGTIARQLGVHHTTVDRVLCQAGLPEAGLAPRPSMIDPFVPFVRQTLANFPDLTAARLYHMACERGYAGSESHFRHRIARLRPRKTPEAYLRLRTLKAEQGQVDWGHFGHVEVGRARRPLMAFVMVLSYSRQIFLRFFLSARMDSFLRGHVEAFAAWDGLPRVLLYDNLKSAVLERRGRAIRFHPQLLDLAAHYRFEPRPVAVARGNEKGRVERAIRYVRSNFFAGRSWTDLDDLNAQAAQWTAGPAALRRCPEEPEITVGDAFALEQSFLLTLPDDAFECQDHVPVAIGKTPYARFDLNDYSVPHVFVQRTLTAVATAERVRIVDGLDVVADHPRSYDAGRQVEDPAHIQALIDVKHAAAEHRGKDRLFHAAAASSELLELAAREGHNLGSITAALLRLLDRYGAAELQSAIIEALQRGVPHPNAVRLNLQRRREDAGKPPPLPIALPNDPRVRNVTVKTHDLNEYDQLDSDHD